VLQSRRVRLLSAKNFEGVRIRVVATARARLTVDRLGDLLKVHVERGIQRKSELNRGRREKLEEKRYGERLPKSWHSARDVEREIEFARENVEGTIEGFGRERLACKAKEMSYEDVRWRTNGPTRKSCVLTAETVNAAMPPYASLALEIVPSLETRITMQAQTMLMSSSFLRACL
jgi:hypothetical protein